MENCPTFILTTDIAITNKWLQIKQQKIELGSHVWVIMMKFKRKIKMAKKYMNSMRWANQGKHYLHGEAGLSLKVFRQPREGGTTGTKTDSDLNQSTKMEDYAATAPLVKQEHGIGEKQWGGEKVRYTSD